MRRGSVLGLLALGLLAIGCNQPAVTPKAPYFQESENTIRDWQNVAARIATHMASVGLLPPSGPAETSYPKPQAVKPVFIQVQAPDSAFLREVGSELEANILRRGGVVARTPLDATVVNLDVNVIRWGPRDKPPGLIGTTAALLAIPPLVIGASLPMTPWTAAGAVAYTAAGIGILADGLVALTPTMNAEAVWQASIVTRDQVVMKLEEPVYIREYDIPLYTKATSLRPMVSGGGEPLRTRVILYSP